MSKSPDTTHPNSIGFYIYCFGQISVTIERKSPNPVPLDAEKNSAQITIHRKIDFVRSVCGLSCDGIVKISTTGMGAQSRLHGWQFSSWKRTVIEKTRVKVCDKTSLTETHMALWTITFHWLTENFCSWFLENGAFLPSYFITLSDGSRPTR